MTKQPQKTTALPQPAPKDPGARSLRQGRLGVLPIVFFVVAAVAPLGAITGGATVVFASVGVTTALMYLLVGGLFAVFSVGFVTMSKHVSNAGGFVAYIAKGLGARAGTMLAGITVLGYVALVSGLWGFFGGITELTMDAFGVHLPAWAWAALGLALVTALCYRGINVSLWGLGTLLLLEVAGLVILAAAIFGQGGNDGLNLDAFNPALMIGPGAGIGFLFAVLCFTGFEATVVFSEESREPQRTIPRATYVAIAFIGMFYSLITWAIGLGWGSNNIQKVASTDPGNVVFALATEYVGPWLTTVLGLLILTSLIAMFLGFHNIAARYLFALGRAGVLPQAFGRTTSAGTPRIASLAFSSVVALVVGVFVASGADMITTIYSWLTALGTVCILAALLVTSIAVVVFFARTGLDSRPWHTKIAPTVAALGLLCVGSLAVSNYSTLLGGTGEGARLLLMAIPLAALAGWWWSGRQAARGKNIRFDNSLL